MYKVKEAADVLGVTRVEIFEIMVSQRELFEPYVSKKNSITYISEDGLNLLKQILASNAETSENVELLAVDSVMNTETESLPAETFVETVAVLPENLEEARPEIKEISDIFSTSKGNLKSIRKIGEEQEDPSEQLEVIEASDDLIGQWLKEIQIEDEEADQQDELLKQLRTQLTQMRNKILTLDSEIRRKDDAIKHYHEIMKDDVRWLEDLERKVQLIVKHSILEKADTGAEEYDEEKNNRFKFFKK